MLVAELIAPRQFQLVDRELGKLAAGEVRVHVGAVGICGSDLHSYGEGAIGDTDCIYPMVLGHEPAGTVAAVGAGVTGWAPGDRAALEPALYCYHCEYCLSGRHNICANVRFLSTPGHAGFFREFVDLPAHNLLAIPKEMSMPMATVIEPLAVALHSMLFASIRIGETVAVFGAGPIGLLTIACLRASGAGRIWVVEPVAHRREIALKMGAAVAIDPNQTDSAREILRETAGRGVDCSIDCAAKDHTINWAIRAARNGGRVVLTGIHSQPLIPFEVSPMRRKELTIFNVRRSNHEPEAARAFLVERPDWFAPLITHTRPLSDVAAAFQMLESYSDGVGKLVIV
ncbi:MAG TPA: alcohol dehydrogenase catalytic domain-containing protein [Bryobacteraceae bacterium]|nr:alcohol dehydrogenase catalytic domain-containing protein [Bryobacteraceae bacterium]